MRSARGERHHSNKAVVFHTRVTQLSRCSLRGPHLSQPSCPPVLTAVVKNNNVILTLPPHLILSATLWVWLPSVWQLPAYCDLLEAPWSLLRAMAPWVSTDTPLAIRLRDQSNKHERRLRTVSPGTSTKGKGANKESLEVKRESTLVRI